jgi:hypothetical protein
VPARHALGRERAERLRLDEVPQPEEDARLARARREPRALRQEHGDVVAVLRSVERDVRDDLGLLGAVERDGDDLELVGVRCALVAPDRVVVVGGRRLPARDVEP